jgi:hypothetical protein
LKEPYRIEGKKTMGFELAEQFGAYFSEIPYFQKSLGITNRYSRIPYAYPLLPCHIERRPRASRSHVPNSAGTRLYPHEADATRSPPSSRRAHIIIVVGTAGALDA